MIGRFGDGLLQAGDVGGVGGETQGETFIANVGIVAFQFLICYWQVVETFHCFLSALVFFVFQEAVAFGLAAFSNQIEEFQFSKSLAQFSHLLIVKSDGKTAEIQFVVSCDIFEIVFLDVFFLEEISGFDHFEGGCAFDVDQLGMGSEEIFNPSGGHGQNGKSFCSVEDHVFDWRGVGQFGVGGRNNCVEILEDFLHGYFEGQVAADNLEGVVLCDGIGDLFLGGEFIDVVQF